jgi:hypothetical protein
LELRSSYFRTVVSTYISEQKLVLVCLQYLSCGNYKKS